MREKSLLKTKPLAEKKEWQKPTIEIIGKNTIESGNNPGALEGVPFTIFGSTFYGNRSS